MGGDTAVGKLLRCIILCVLSVVLLILVYFIFVPWSISFDHSSKGRLIVNGQIIDDPNIVIYSHGETLFSDIPFLTVLDALGYGVIQEDTFNTRIEVDSKEFLLSDHKLYTRSGKVLTRLTGNNEISCESSRFPGEIYVEHNSLKRIMKLMGIRPISIEISRSEKTVTVLWDKGR